MRTREEIIIANPIVDVMQDRGIVFKRQAGKLVTNRCASTEHKVGHLCVGVEIEKQVWYCADCEEGGSVIDFVMKADGLDAKGAMEKLGGGNGAEISSRPATASPARNSESKGKIVKLYDYTDETGALLYQVCRFEPKDFRQRRPDGSGGWTYSLGDCRRVLYNLPAVKAADFVWLTEGEKDADTICSFGFVGTTNGMGAEKWLPEYSAALRGMDVAILPDGDEKGSKHLALLLKELGPVAKSLRVIPMPDGYKDISDYAATFPTMKAAATALLEIAGKAEVLYRGATVPVQTIEEMEEEYKEYVKRCETVRLPLGTWLPSLACIRPMVPGEVLALLAGTGVGKTMCLHNIAIHARLTTLLFELELPSTLSFERLAAIAIDGSGKHVEDMYRSEQAVRWRESGRLKNIFSVHKPRLDTKEISRIIEAAELKTSLRPALVLVDYVQLIGSKGDSRYERLSGVMEEMKIVARETNTVIVIASQVGRGHAEEVTLESGKDSGSIENSAGIVLGAWRDKEPDRMWIRVLKNTKGKSGITVPCQIKESLRIVELAKEELL